MCESLLLGYFIPLVSKPFIMPVLTVLFWVQLYSKFWNQEVSPQINFKNKKKILVVWLRWLSIIPCTTKVSTSFPVWGPAGGSWLMFLIYFSVSLPSPYPFLFLQNNKIKINNNEKYIFKKCHPPTFFFLAISLYLVCNLCELFSYKFPGVFKNLVYNTVTWSKKIFFPSCCQVIG